MIELLYLTLIMRTKKAAGSNSIIEPRKLKNWTTCKLETQNIPNKTDTQYLNNFSMCFYQIRVDNELAFDLI